MFKCFVAVAIASMFAVSVAHAQTSAPMGAPSSGCEAKAMGKDGKPLAGAAKTSFMKKCMASDCESKAVSSKGKPLSGAAKTSFMKKCQAGQ